MKLISSNKLVAVIFIYLITFIELSQIENRLKFRTSKDKKNRVTESKLGSISKITNLNTLEKHTVPEGCVKLFYDCNYKGESLLTCDDKSYSFSWGANLSSIIIGPNTKVVLFSSYDYGDESYLLTESKPCLMDFNDKTRSHRIIKKNCVVLFDNCDYKGSSIKVCQSESNLGTIWKNDSLSSIIMGFDTNLTIFEHDEFKGRSLNIKENIQCLDDPKYKFNDITTSIQIFTENKFVDVLNVSNPFLNFLIGVGEGLAGNNTGFYKCFPEKWKTKVDSELIEKDHTKEAFNGWNKGLRIFFDATTKVIKVFCEFREVVMTAISALGVYALKKIMGNKKKFRTLSFIELKSSSIKSLSAFKRNYLMKNLKNVSSSKVHGFIEDVRNYAFKKWIQPITDKISEFIINVQEFFKSKKMKKIMKFVNCALSTVNAGSQIYFVYKGFKDKFQIFMDSLTNPILLVIVVVDYFISLLCNWGKFKTGLNYFINAWNTNNTNLKWLMYGKAIGTFFNAIGTARTFSELYKKIQEEILKKK